MLRRLALNIAGLSYGKVRALAHAGLLSTFSVFHGMTLLYRAVMILHAVVHAGGQVSLEQPRNAMSWLEPMVQSFLLDISADLVVVAACQLGRGYEKTFDVCFMLAASTKFGI